MNEQDFTLLSQYLDGELAPAEASRLEGRMAQDADLAAGLTRLRELNSQLRGALAARDSVPARVTELLTASTQTQASPAAKGEVLRFPGAAQPAARAVTERRWPYALAASLVLAVGVGILVETGDPNGNTLPGNDPIVSAALDRHLSGDGWVTLDDGRELQPVLTFPNRDGGWCREYLLRGGDDDWRAVACREGDRWVTQAAGLESFIDSGQAYRPAGASDAAPVAVFISQHAADIALDRDAETALLANWRR